MAEERDRAPPEEWEERARGWEEEVVELAQREWTDPNCRRIAKRLSKHRGELFTFVVCPGVEGTNNAAERVLRPYVVRRKISGGHRSWAGARKHEILMSVLATCRLRGEDFLATVTGALEAAVASEPVAQTRLAPWTCQRVNSGKMRTDEGERWLTTSSIAIGISCSSFRLP